MFFESSKPVTGPEFFNRTEELKELLRSVEILRQGSTHYLALLGWRKVGKTSLLWQFMATARGRDVSFLSVDCWEKKPTPKIFFQDYLIQTLDGFVRDHVTTRLRNSIGAALFQEGRLLSTIADLRQLGINAITDGTELLLELRRNGYSDTLFAGIIDLPERIACETNTYFVAIIDEFQELKDLNHFKAIKENIGDISAFFRARWSRHKRVNYIISGSKITMMRELLTRERVPLFQHFKILEVGVFSEMDARTLLRELSHLAERPIPEDLIDKLLVVAGTHPFYLQVLGEELCSKERLDEDAFKVTVQENLFNSTGRLALYFQDLVGRIVGRSSSLEQTLIQIAHQPGTLSQLSTRMDIGTGTLKSWIDRASDLITASGGIYQIADPCLRLYLAAKSQIRAILPALVLGDEAEQAVARHMAAAGFNLIYQSRASRGAFDLLAISGTKEIGIQVKKAHLPYYLPREKLHLMKHWAERLHWIPLLALVIEKDVRFYDINRLQTKGRSCRIDEKAETIDNLLVLQ